MSTCEHVFVEVRDRVRPPKHMSFAIRFMRCDICQSETTTTKQRRKNRHNAAQAYQNYYRSVQSQS